jgi:hypothetical protein
VHESLNEALAGGIMQQGAKGTAPAHYLLCLGAPKALKMLCTRGEKHHLHTSPTTPSSLTERGHLNPRWAALVERPNHCPHYWEQKKNAYWYSITRLQECKHDGAYRGASYFIHGRAICISVQMATSHQPPPTTLKLTQVISTLHIVSVGGQNKCGHR